MGFRVDIEGLKIEISDYTVEEASSPLAAGDSSGSVGSFTVTIPVPDDYVPLPERDSPWKTIRLLGPQFLIDKSVRLYDSRKGFTLGTIRTSNYSQDGGTIQLAGTSRLGQLNVYGIQAQPFVGTLREAFAYYLGLANIDTDLFVDDAIGDRQVVFPGWNGELWYFLKLMSAAQDCDISLVSGVILLRSIRTRIATENRDTARSITTGGDTLAQAVEVYQYNNREITDELVYPPTGWNAEVDVLNVNAEEEAEYTLELSASVSSIQPPVMQEFVSQEYGDSSVYTVVADDGLPVSPEQWAGSGGLVTVEIGEDTTHLIVRLRGASGVPTSAGTAAQNFSIALGSDTTGNRYSTLRIVGTGVAYTKTKKRIRTTVPPSKTATDIGVTIDNPFISTTNDLYRAGTRAAKQYAGAVMSLSGAVIAINRRGDTGQANYPTYGQVENELKSVLGGAPTYAEVQSYYEAELGGGSTWVETRRNLIERPVAIVNGDWQAGTVLDPSFTRRPGAASIRRTLTTASATLINPIYGIPAAVAGAFPVVEGNTYTASHYGSASVANFRTAITVVWINSGGGVVGQSIGPIATGGVVGSWLRSSVTDVAPAGAVQALPVGYVLAATGSSEPIGTQAWVMDPLMEQSDTVGEFFPPDLNTPTERAVWAGVPNESALILESFEGVLISYEQVRQYWFEFFRDDDIDQVFGNVQGARIYDRKSRRWYRIRQGNLTPPSIGIGSADDDLIHGDIQALYQGMTYSDVTAIMQTDTLNYREAELLGLYLPLGGVTPAPPLGAFPGPTVYPSSTLYPSGA